MKAFVIKNKDGEYLRETYGKNGENCWTTDIIDAMAYDLNEFVPRPIKNGILVPITIAEGNLEEENRVLKRAYLSACEKLSEVFGECPYSNMNLPMPEYCDEECVNNEKYLCWDKYFIEQAKGEKYEN